MNIDRARLIYDLGTASLKEFYQVHYGLLAASLYLFSLCFDKVRKIEGFEIEGTLSAGCFFLAALLSAFTLFSSFAYRRRFLNRCIDIFLGDHPLKEDFPDVYAPPTHSSREGRFFFGLGILSAAFALFFILAGLSVPFVL